MNPAITLLIVVVVYFFPLMVAALRGHHQTAAIFVLNLFLGWTFLGWVVALIWAVTAVKSEPAKVPEYESQPGAHDTGGWSGSSFRMPGENK